MGTTREAKRALALEMVNDLFDQYPDGDIEVKESIDYEPVDVLGLLEAREHVKDARHTPVRYNIKIHMKL